MGLFDSLFGGGDDVQVPEIDPKEMLRTQSQANRVNQITPFGNVTFSGPYRNQLNFTLSPEMQALFEQQTAFGQEAGARGRQMLGGLPMSGDAAVNAQLQRLQPGFDLQERRLREQLEQSGNPAAFGGIMSEGAFNELALMNQGQNDARLAAVLQGPAYQGQLINNALGLGAGSPIGVPQFNFQGASPLDVTGSYGMAQNANMFNAQQAQQSRSDILGGLFDLGGAAISAGLFSDRRLKTDIQRIGTTEGGQPLYRYRYKAGGPMQIGVMADESPPDAVSVHESGYLMVDYGRIV